MMVAGRVPSRNAFICDTMCSFGRPASPITSLVALRAAGLSWAVAASGAAASAAAMSSRFMAPPGAQVTPGPRKSKGRHGGRPFQMSESRSGDGRGLFLEGELDLLVLADVDCHLAAVLQPAEEQLVGEPAADGVLDQARHRARAHQRVEALLGEVRLQRVGEARLDL